nr:MAG TPA: hypothetical protein [Caudoviricetes sp.]
MKTSKMNKKQKTTLYKTFSKNNNLQTTIF